MSRETIFDACRRNDTDRVLQYIQKGGCLTEWDAQKMTLLHHAAFAGSLILVQALLSVGPPAAVDVEAADGEGWTALHYAADRGFVEVVQVLIDEGANVNARDVYRRTPLHLAALGGHEATAAALRASGASATLKNVAGKTPEDCARERAASREGAV